MSALVRHTGMATFRALASAYPATPAKRCPACRIFSTSLHRRDEASPRQEVRPELKVPGYIKNRLSSSCRDLLTSTNDDICSALSAVYELRTKELRERALRTKSAARYRKSGVELELHLIASQLDVAPSMLPKPPVSCAAPELDENGQLLPMALDENGQPMPTAKRKRKPSKKPKRKPKKTALPPWDSNVTHDSPWTHLPPMDYWPATFAKGKGFLTSKRSFVKSEETAKKIVDRLNLGDGTGQKHTIIELYAGPGTLTRTLLEHPAVEKVIAVEDARGSLQFLEALKEDARVKGGAPGDRLHIQAGNPYHWSTYDTMVEALDHLEGRITGDRPGEFLNMRAPSSVRRTCADPSWQAPAPITVVFQMPRGVQSEQLFAQLIAAIPVRQWMYAYGRVRMALITTEALANRVQSEPGDRAWAKLGVMMEALVKVDRVIQSEELEPLKDHFWPPDLLTKPVPTSRKAPIIEAKYKMCMLMLEPKLEPMLDHDTTDAFQYIIRNVMVVRSRTVTEGLKHAAPGAHNLLRRLHPLHPDMKGRPKDAIDPDCKIAHLTARQFVSLAKAFEKWPFRPKILFEEGRLADEDR